MHENLPSQILVYRQINITLRRGHWGLLKTTKPLEKSSKTTKPQKNDKKPKTACKTVETEKFSHPSYQNHNRSDTELTNGAKRGFAAMRDRWGEKCRSD